MSVIHFTLVRVRHQRTKRRRIVQQRDWSAWTPDLTPYAEAEPVRPELGVVLTEQVLRGPDPLGETRDALGAVWADLGRAGVNGALLCVLALVFLFVAGRGR